MNISELVRLILQTIMSEVLPKPDLKFFTSWIITSVGMFSASYIWHGIILNDFLRISYPKDIFLSIAALVYLGIGLLISVLTYALKKLKDSFKYGIAVGAAMGVFIYAIAFILGISFYTTVDVKMIAFDGGWQTLEQGFGGLVCALVYRTMTRREKSLMI